MEGRMGQGNEGNVAPTAALLLGLGYLGIGLVGFAATGFTGFVEDTNESLLGFDLNIFHNIVHFAIGLGLVLASQLRDVSITQGVLIGVGLFYVLAALLGFINYLQIISIDGNFAPINFFHLLTGVGALLFGLIGARQQNNSRGSGPDTGRRGTRPMEERRAAWDRGGTYREGSY
ncbi:MAG: DUF4383 domain-containing protein [Thermoleophilaceae bacterium]|nr:DUF4383 domain-containing protein [Thermoleophilaceae bacterium]